MRLHSGDSREPWKGQTSRLASADPVDLRWESLGPRAIGVQVARPGASASHPPGRSDQRVFPALVGPVWASPGDCSYFSIPWRAGQHVVGEQPPGWAVGLTILTTLPLPNPSPGPPS